MTSFGKSGGRYQIQGLRDPLAADPSALLQQRGLDAGKAAFRWGAFYALDDAIVEKRAVALLQPPSGVTLRVQNGVLTAAGNCTYAWARTLRERAPLIAGINSVDDSRLYSLGSTVILFDVARAEINPRQRDNIAAAAQEIQRLLQAAPNGPVIELVGHADSTGAEATNVLLSQERADNAMRALVRLGIPAQSPARNRRRLVVPAAAGDGRGESPVQSQRHVSSGRFGNPAEPVRTVPRCCTRKFACSGPSLWARPA